MELKFYLDKRVVLKDCVHKQTEGKTVIITYAHYNENNDIILWTDLPHPEDENTVLWINTSQIAYIKQYEYSVNVYMNKQTFKNICINFELKGEDIKRIGSFDIYKKYMINEIRFKKTQIVLFKALTILSILLFIFAIIIIINN